MSRVVAIGETMALFRQGTPGQVTVGNQFRLSVAGAESNTAVGLARLGHDVAWVGRVGSDPLGAAVIASLRGQGVDTQWVVTDQDAPTGILVRAERVAAVNVVHYQRRHSAGSRLRRVDIEPAFASEVSVLHLSGITLALSPESADAGRHAIDLARSRGALVSFDVNHRSRLIDVSSAGRHLAGVLAHIDLLFCGEDEMPVLRAAVEDAPDPVARALELGVRGVVVKRGHLGARVHSDGHIYELGAAHVSVHDAVGAGDAFAAGYISALLDGEPERERLRRATQVAAFCISTPGDWEGLPTRNELSMIDLPAGATLR